MNPWDHVAPKCPTCDAHDQMYLWDFENPDQWYCARCQRIYDVKEGRDVGDQQTLG